jgi:alkyldihydroxyacetonephosphate synthase
MCFSMEVVAGTGEVVETSRWQPDLTQLFIGSEGTLGIITEATLRVEPAAEQRFYRGFRFHTLQAALDAIRRLVQRGYRPAVVRLYDEFDSLLARGRRRGRERDDQAAASEPDGLVARLGRFFGERVGGVAKDTLRKTASGLLRRALGSPLWLNRAAGALPVGCLLIIGFEGPEGLTEAESADAFAALRRDGEDLGAGPGEHWFENRFAISYKQSPTFDLGAFVDTMEVSTTWDNLLRLYHQVRQAVARHAFIMAHFSHVYPEGSSIYFTFAGIAPDGEPIERLYERTWRAALEAVRQAGASITHHHGAGLSKAAYLASDHRGGADLHDLLKARFDPQRIMNPGKLWDVAQVPPAETTA